MTRSLKPQLSKKQFREIFLQNYSSLCNYALKMVGDFSEAEEIVQDLFVQLWKRGTLDNVSDPEPYLLRCVRFKSIDYLRYKDTKMEIRLESWHGATNTSLDE
jgi:RNA polymerase sigma factor (sigma-70 family)